MLWVQFQKVLEAFGSKDADETDPVVAGIVAQFANVDPRPCSYRYPVDIHGKPITLEFEQLDLEALQDVLSALNMYFRECDGYFDHLQGVRA